MTSSTVGTSGVQLAPARSADLLRQAAELAARHTTDVLALPVAPPEPEQDLRRRMDDWLARYDFAAPADPAQVLADTTEQLRWGGVHTTHPGYFGLFNPAPTAPGIAADVVAAALNPQLAAASHAPAA
ncbi:MAG: hypothetical protein ACRDXB_21120, partial [Actinomycetes bacterium]